MTFDEALGENQQFTDVVRLAPATSPRNVVSGNFNLCPDRRTITFTPSALVPNLRYRITVTGQKDLFGNTQSNVFTSTFTTIDNSPPALYDFLIDSQIVVEGLVIENQRPRFYIGYTDDIGINTAATKLYLARQGEPLQAVQASVTQNYLQYQPLQSLEAGQYITKAVVTDTAGNESSTPEITFTINPQLPELYTVYQQYGVTTGKDVVTVRGRNLFTQFNAPDESARGLLGEYSASYYYYNYPPFHVVKTDSEINFDFMGESLSPYFSSYGNEKVTWKGQIIPRYSEEYTFTFELSGGVKIYIGENLILDEQNSEAVRQASGNITLEAGQPYDIRIEHFGNYRYPHPAKLFWASPSQTLEIVPQEQLRPAAQAVSPNVLFGGEQATVIGAVSNTDYDEITVLTPAHNVGTVNVDVQLGTETLSLTNGFEYYEDQSPPYPQRYSPASVTNITPPSRISVSFNEPLAPEQDFNNILKVFDATGEYIPIAGNVTLDETSRKLTFVPTVPLAENTRYVISVSNQSDLSGNVNTSEYSEEFSTTDHTAPEIYYVSPEDQSVTFDRNPSIAAYFGDSLSAIDPNSSVMIIDGTDVTAQANKYYSAIQYTPPTPLSFGSHTVTFRVSDIAGNTVEKTITFTVEADTEPPVITNFTIDNKPAVDGVQTRYRRPFFVVSFTDNGPVPYNQQKIYLGPQGGQLSLISSYFSGGSNGGTLYGSVSQDLAFGFYTVRVELVDKAGNTKSQSVNFELIDLETVPPQVTAITPAYNAQEVALDAPIIVTFSEPLDPNQNFANSMTVRNSQDYQPIEGTYSLNSQGNILTFTPAQPFAGDSTYYVNLTGYLDLAGNEGYYFSSYFSTIDTIAPVLAGKLGVGGNSGIYGDLIDLNNARIYSRTPDIYVSCSDNLSGINPSSFTFTLDGVSYSLNTQCNYGGRYRPPAPLEYGIHTVTAQVSDNSGNSGQISETFEIIPDPSLPFAVEDDTLLLWRLDEFYCSDGCQIPDSGPYKFKVYEYLFRLQHHRAVQQRRKKCRYKDEWRYTGFVIRDKSVYGRGMDELPAGPG